MRRWEYEMTKPEILMTNKTQNANSGTIKVSGDVAAPFNPVRKLF
ncbi:unnamed protein product [marine sediment metagenome]|uniref:Uncharacterized protein n=1 Tax=marine sediment metagenome TaxID=412755 RepID=X1IFC3_9ZZZZ